MSKKRDWYALASRILGWEENRNHKTEYFFAGSIVGAMISTYGVVGAITLVAAGISLRSMGILLLIFALIIVTPVCYFGYRGLRSVIKQAVFKWSVIGGICLGIVGWIIAFLLNPPPAF